MKAHRRQKGQTAAREALTAGDRDDPLTEILWDQAPQAGNEPATLTLQQTQSLAARAYPEAAAAAGAAKYFPGLTKFNAPVTMTGPDGKPQLVRFPQGAGAPVPVAGYRPNQKPSKPTRSGRKLGGHVSETIDSDDLMVIAGRVAKVIDKVRPAKVFLNATDLGAGVYDRLREMKYNQVEGINVAQSPIDDRKWSNKRADMWGLLGEWLADSAGVDIPDEDDLHSDFCAPVWGRSFLIVTANQSIYQPPVSSPCAVYSKST